MTTIEWTQETWNPLVGCSRVSEGCRHCYAERQAYRAAAMGISRYDGITKKVGDEIRWTGKVALVESALNLPLKWKKPRRIFVNSMSDLFHEAVKDEWIDLIFEKMVESRDRGHTFQILTKRPERMLRYMQGLRTRNDLMAKSLIPAFSPAWPHIWLGVSVEDQATADARIPLLLQTQAAVRWCSYEPALGPVDFDPFLHDSTCAMLTDLRTCTCTEPLEVALDWLVVGGESGSSARPFDLTWARQTIAQCRAAGTACFVKQLGAWPCGRQAFMDLDPQRCGRYVLRDRKGGDPAEWPEDLRVREYPR